MLATIGSAIMSGIQAATKYSATDAKKDIEQGKKYDFSTCQFLTNGDNASKKYLRTKDDSTVDRFAQTFPDTFKKGSKKLEELKVWRAGIRALSHVPHSMFAYDGARKKYKVWVYKILGKEYKIPIPTQAGIRDFAMETALKIKEKEVLEMVGNDKLTNGAILKGIFTPPTDEKKRDAFLNALRFAAGGYYILTGKLENLKEFKPENNLEDLEKFKPENVALIIKPAEALIVSAAYYMAAQQLQKGECKKDGTIEYTDAKKASEYIEKAKTWETIARRAYSQEIALQFEQDKKKFEENNRKAEDPYNKIQRVNAHFKGWYESGNVQFRDETFTKIHRDTVSPMLCGPDGKDADASYFFSTFRNPIVAMWWQARHGALGCFGEIKVKGGYRPPTPDCTPTACPPGKVFNMRRCRCVGKPPPDTSGEFGTQDPS